MVLVAIVLAGWPMIVVFSRPRADDKPPPRPIVASEVRPVKADEGVEFEALVDKAPIQPRESAAYGELLRRARQVDPADLTKASRKDILFTHLWERPKLYRGVPIHIEGTAKRVLTYEVNPGLAPGGRLFEAWVFSDENRVLPYVLIFEEAPAGLPIGPDVFARVKFDGYFLKLLRYTASDGARPGPMLMAAPMLVGRLSATPPLAEAPGPMVELRNFSRRDGFVVVFVLLLGYIAARGFFQVRKALAPRRLARSSSGFQQGLPPDEVAEWLQDLDESGEPPIDPGPLREPPDAP